MSNKPIIIGGAVILVGIAIYIVYVSKNKNNNTKNLSPPMEVDDEENNNIPETKDNNIFFYLNKIKQIIESIKNSKADTPPINQ